MSRLVLAFDTSTEAIAIALGRRDGEVVTTVDCEDVVAPRAALSRVLPGIEALLARNGIAPAALDEIVVGRGPGSFTGVRIAVATAKGVAHGLGAPLYGVGTLDAVAWGLANHEGLVGVIGDAMRSEVYPALFRTGGGIAERLDPDSVAKPRDVASEWALLGEPVLLAGNGLHKYAGLFGHANMSLAPESLWAPSGAGLLAAFAREVQLGLQGDGDAGSLLPVYTRLSDAEENERARSGRGQQTPPASGVGGPGEGGER